MASYSAGGWLRWRRAGGESSTRSPTGGWPARRARVTAAVEAVALGLAAGVLDRTHAAERRERGLAVEPVRVVAGGHQQLGGTHRADPWSGQQPWHDPADDGGDVLIVVGDLGVQVLPAAGQGTQGDAGAVGAGQGDTGGSEVGDASAVDLSAQEVG